MSSANNSLSIFDEEELILGALSRFSKENEEGLSRFDTLFNSFKDSYKLTRNYDDADAEYVVTVTFQEHAKKLGSKKVFEMLEEHSFDSKYKNI